MCVEVMCSAGFKGQRQTGQLHRGLHNYGASTKNSKILPKETQKYFLKLIVWDKKRACRS